MPKIEVHEEAATRNQTVLSNLLKNYDTSPDDFAPWVVTVAFYKALHLVEGIFYMDGMLSQEKRPFHSKDHKERNQRLKDIKKFGHIWKNYRPLFEASMVARYLFDPNSGAEQTNLNTYLSGNSVYGQFINHHLRQIEKSFDVKKRIIVSANRNRYVTIPLMQIEHLPLSAHTPYAKNPRKNKKGVAAVKRSIARQKSSARQ